MIIITRLEIIMFYLNSHSKVSWTDSYTILQKIFSLDVFTFVISIKDHFKEILFAHYPLLKSPKMNFKLVQNLIVFEKIEAVEWMAWSSDFYPVLSKVVLACADTDNISNMTNQVKPPVLGY